MERFKLYVRLVSNAFSSVRSKEAYSRILAGVVHYEASTAGVFAEPFGDVVDLSVKYDPAVGALLVLGHLLPRVRGETVFWYLWR